MKILIVCSATNNHIAPFITEQADSLECSGELVEFYLIKRKGIKGYLQALQGLKSSIRNFKPDIIHAHYGLSGLLANLQRKIPVVTTFHGSDINDPKVFKWSKWAIRFSSFSIFVSQKTIEIANVSKRFALLPCGVNILIFKPIKKQEAREQLGWDLESIYVLFSGTKDSKVKNYNLAQQAIEHIPGAQLIELKERTREEVNLALNGADIALMTSFSEGSPQFIKEALACNCPIVSTDVGDVQSQTDGIDGCYITSYDINSVVENLKKAISFVSIKNRTEGRLRLEAAGLTDKQITTELIKIYKTVLKQ